MILHSCPEGGEMNSQERLDEAPAAALLVQMATGHMVSQAIYAAAKLGIADLVSDGSRTSEALALAAGANPEALYRLLRMLAARGVFREEEGRWFGQSPISAFLQTHRMGSLRDAVILWNEEQYRGWGALLHSVTTGETGFDHVFEMPLFQYLGQQPEAAKTFNAAMTAWTTQTAAAVAHTYDFSKLKKLVDVGGGHAMMLASILNVVPGLEGVVFDLTTVASGAEQAIDAAGLSKRCTVASGDFFVEVPSGGDGYLLSQVLHDWDDERSLVILRNCHHAMHNGGTILVVETVLSSETDSSFGTLSDLHMLVVAGGRERTESEYRELLAQAGFELTRIVPTGAPQSIIEGSWIPSGR
jgi:hypothetical protein